jgi:hypothetical protein
MFLQANGMKVCVEKAHIPGKVELLTKVTGMLRDEKSGMANSL